VNETNTDQPIINLDIRISFCKEVMQPVTLYLPCTARVLNLESYLRSTEFPRMTAQ
jgi:hypothetical protein